MQLGATLATVAEWCRELLEKEEPRCLECGECCKAFSWHLKASEQDLERWKESGRDDLLARVNRLGWIWVDPHTKERLPVCPFLQEVGPERSICTIHDVKPDMCRDYPPLEQHRICLRGTFLS